MIVSRMTERDYSWRCPSCGWRTDDTRCEQHTCRPDGHGGCVTTGIKQQSGSNPQQASERGGEHV